MIIRPPQHGHGGRQSSGRGGIGIAASAAFGLGLGRGEKFAGARDVGLAAGAGEQPVVADAVEALRQDVEQEAPDELARIERHGAVALAARCGGSPCSGRSRRPRRARSAGCWRWRRGGCSATDRRAPPRVRRRAAWHRRTSSSFRSGARKAAKARRSPRPA